MKIYTKTGDLGETSLIGGVRTAKDDKRIECYGTLDELNSTLGVAITHLDASQVDIQTLLQRIQHDLFTLGAELAAQNDRGKFINIPRVNPQHVEFLEKEVDKLDQKLGLPSNFILPGGNKAGAFLHLARTIARRAERNVVTLTHEHEINPEILKYLNRLSDLLYMLARDANKELEQKEQKVLYNFFGAPRQGGEVEKKQ